MKQKFKAFHGEHPEVYSKLETLAQEWFDAGHTHCGIGMLYEVVRWQTGLGAHDERYRLNNNHRAFYARRLRKRHPNWPKGFFETRKQTNGKKTEDAG